MSDEDLKYLPQDPDYDQRLVMRNPAYDECQKYLVIGYQQIGVDSIIAVVQKDSGATPEQIQKSWEEFEKRRLEYDPYKCINTGPTPIFFPSV